MSAVDVSNSTVAIISVGLLLALECYRQVENVKYCHVLILNISTLEILVDQINGLELIVILT